VDKLLTGVQSDLKLGHPKSAKAALGAPLTGPKGRVHSGNSASALFIDFYVISGKTPQE
jgi:hypothetical protein